VQTFNMRAKSIQSLVAIGAWAAIMFIAYATLTRAGFVYAIYYKLSPLLLRPEMQTYAHFEHVIAFFVVGALFSFAYPRQTILVCSIVLGGAVLLEILQTLTPDRHGTLVDALEKMAGGAAGIFLARGLRQFGSSKADHIKSG
jgi:VanZ family protein